MSLKQFRRESLRDKIEAEAEVKEKAEAEAVKSKVVIKRKNKK